MPCRHPDACRHNPVRKRDGRVCRSCARSEALQSQTLRQLAAVHMTRGRIAKAQSMHPERRRIVKIVGAREADRIIAEHMAARQS